MVKFSISWEAPEYEYREKSISWYWTSIIIAAFIVAFSVWQKNFLFGFFVILAEILFIVWGNREPRTVRFSIDESGLEIDNGTRYAWTEFENMSVNPMHGGWDELIFTHRAKFKSQLKILIKEEQIVEFRANMKTVLKEMPYEPTLLDSIEKLLGF